MLEQLDVLRHHHEKGLRVGLVEQSSDGKSMMVVLYDEEEKGVPKNYDIYYVFIYRNIDGLWEVEEKAEKIGPRDVLDRIFFKWCEWGAAEIDKREGKDEEEKV
jgi:hypothetical protein